MAKQSFYESLGVNKSASVQEIKRAYRSKAAEVHPDKGGNGDEMAEINRAYACLRNPQLRLTYDTTGEEPKPDVTEQLAQHLLAQAFTSFLENEIHDHLLERLKQGVVVDKENINKHKAETQARIDELQGRLDDLTVSQGANLWRSVIEQQIGTYTSKLEMMNRDLAVRDRILELVANYNEKTLGLILVSVSTSITFGALDLSGS